MKLFTSITNVSQSFPSISRNHPKQYYWNSREVVNFPKNGVDAILLQNTVNMFFVRHFVRTNTLQYILTCHGKVIKLAKARPIEWNIAREILARNFHQICPQAYQLKASSLYAPLLCVKLTELCQYLSTVPYYTNCNVLALINQSLEFSYKLVPSGNGAIRRTNQATHGNKIMLPN